MAAAVPHGNAIGIDDDVWSHPDLSLAAGARRPAPRFPLEVFAPSWRDWIKRKAEGAGAPMDFVVMPLLSVAGAVIGNTRRVSPWPSWQEPFVIWTMPVGFPGDGKSPAADAVFGPLRQFESQLAEDFPRILREWATAKAEARARRERWETEVSAAVKQGLAAKTLPAEATEPERPERPRFLLQDVTPEKLVRVVAANKRGVVVSRDEISGLIEGFGRYHGGKGGSERALWLEAFGARQFVMDRVKDLDGPIIVDNLYVCVTGGIQPDRLVDLLLRSADDGFASRFSFAWPEPVGPARPRDFSNDSFLLSVLRRLFLLPFGRDEQDRDTPVTIRLNEPAIERFQSWRVKHAEKIKLASGLYASWLGKQFGGVLRLAGVLTFLDWSVAPVEQPAPSFVSAETVERAITFVDKYLSPMAERVFGDAALPDDERAAAAIAKLIAAGQLGLKASGDDRVLLNLRTVQRLKLPKLRRAESVKMAFDVLIEAGWLRPAPSRAGERGGRPRQDFEINALVLINRSRQFGEQSVIKEI